MATTRETVLAYLRAIEHNTQEAFLHADAEVIEHPNRLNPAGVRYDRAALLQAAARGAAVMASQRYDVRGMIVDGDRAAVQIAWSGNLRDGRSMTAQLCSIIELRDGLVWRQEQYDCFE
jgi:ketosteroid isomerase-like protein